ncbi:MAG: KTSC domain-containing protein [Bacilli bacterium]|nr:KTSC domain-containing protein [Bacilli bacterium]
MRKYNLYENKLDRTWFDSSNILYSECDDIENSLKVVRIYFSTGRVYQYKDVDVGDYMMFREDKSQGKAFNKFLKKYECERLEDVDVSIIEKSLNETINSEVKIKNFNVKFNDNVLEVNKITDNGFLTTNTIEINETSKGDIVKLLNLIGIKYE